MAVDNASQIDAIANDKENACLVPVSYTHLGQERLYQPQDRSQRFIQPCAERYSGTGKDCAQRLSLIHI